MSSYIDKNGRQIIFVQPANFNVIDYSAVLTTVLGSCVAVCLRDKKNNLAGLNHFLLPYEKQDSKFTWPQDNNEKPMRYGNHAMELLINKFIAMGADKKSIEAKVFGGANLISSNFNVGQRNIDFTFQYLEMESIPVISFDVGGTLARKIQFNTETGHVDRFFINKDVEQIISEEESILTDTRSSKVEGKIKFF